MTEASAILLVASLALCGCTAAPPNETVRQSPQSIRIEVVTAEEHLGHNIVEGDAHTFWCDGCKARTLPDGEPFVIYWVNTRIQDSPFRFSQGHKCTVWFTGRMKSGVMGYQGKCIDLRQVVKVEDK